ncbi:hypothetical protein [Ralstonia pseudosolanacearum]|uniref:hypothetical protein n=1 Tax=Ralstonia pseudosolanacearum TaxID=1310165 RepID=UPI001FFAB94D|nr:hypothetical protein [Ralstonia pseudosolanacearum]
MSEIVEGAFGLWITALFDGILVPNRSFTFAEQREVFFGLVEKLLHDGKIKFCPPNELWHEGYDIWDAGPEKIVGYLRDHWPASAKSKGDIALSDFFYAMPAILWVGNNGEIV